LRWDWQRCTEVNQRAAAPDLLEESAFSLGTILRASALAFSGSYIGRARDMIWVALATVSLAAAISFTVLATRLQYSK
jgi:hypothetical protein